MIESDIFLGSVELRQLNMYLLKGHEHPLMTGTKDRVATIPNRPGAYDNGASLTPILITLPIGFIRKSRSDIQRAVRQMKDLLIDGRGEPKTFKLIFGYEIDKYYNVRFSGEIPIDRLIGFSGEFNLPLICFDAHSWSTTGAQDITWGSESITFESEVYTYGHSGDGAKTFTVPGSTGVTVSGANVKPIMHIVGSGTNVYVSHGLKTFSLGTFANAIWLIDLGAYTVLKNGVNAIHLISGDWIGIELVKGDNQIDINGTDLIIDFKVEFNDRYY